MRNITIFLTIVFLLTSCGGFGEAGKVLRNEKITNTDEFLVKKREPLILPPDYEKIMVPDTKNEIKENEEDKIKKILKAPETSGLKKNKNSTLEGEILDRIRR